MNEVLERYLIEHCAPTLASLKTASLFCVKMADEELERQLGEWNSRLGKKGLFLTALGRYENRALIYVCRKSNLRIDLLRPGTEQFLAGYGYQSVDVDATLIRLTQRLREAGAFPHEIGVFLGYPLEDVMGFIQNRGKNSRYTGYWKVYCNERETIKRFAQFTKCREVYTRLWNQGKTVWQLTVAA